ncbi:PEP-CTERM sorting domain-containing protein [Rhodoferax sp.]|uniref:PEP-CTERM sorting domain-containing protein n=1 Tax=Rhodoferax sp. TaxID=50421 RepID=UPI00274FF27F|nr:PEP-CTERM sorting domain-containing protein [Rhodoferax sp.]
MDGIAGVDAYYDNVLGITWLRDVHHGAGSVTLCDPSHVIWNDADAWWFFSPAVGRATYNNNSILAYSNTYAMAVHAGDVGRSTEDPGVPVPEPESILLVFGALGALVLVRRRG